MRALNRLFIIALATGITLAASLGIFLFISLIPFAGPIGMTAAGVVIIGLCCVGSLMIAFTYTRISSWVIRRRLIAYGEVVAYLERDGNFTHLSAEHEMAKLPAAPVIEMEETPEYDDQTLIEMHNRGLSLRNIEKYTRVPYSRIQRVTSEAKKRG